jgi:4-amino-4-deoxy-L-arabinose transferase-like glycosyltransferase
MLVAGAGLRYSNAATAPLEGIERFEFIPAATTLSWDHHPIRLAQHGAVPAYLIRLSAALFGDSDLGFRMLGVVVGTATIALLFLIAARWWGSVAGLTVATLLSIERYHATVSARAVDLPFDLFFVTLAVYCFSRFLEVSSDPARTVQAGRWLFGAAAASAVGFLCKEFTALMLPVFFMSLLSTRHRVWLRRPQAWLAAGLFVVLIAPDLYSNLTITPAERADLLGRQKAAWAHRGDMLEDPETVEDGFYMSYGDQLSRFRSIGFNSEPFYFYFGDILNGLGVPHDNQFNEFPFMHPVLAVALWAAVIAAALRRGKDAFTVFLVTMFVALFVPFSLVILGEPRGVFPSDSQALWYWVDRTMLPALLLTGRWAAVAFRRRPASIQR